MKKELRFDEGFDNILVFDYDTEYQNGVFISADTLVETGGRPALSLDGEWNFCPDVFRSLVRSRWFDEVKYNRDQLPIPYDFSFEECDRLHVPGVWNNQKEEYALYEGAGIYFKEFHYQANPGGRVFLKIGAANYETRIWLNKRYLGRHLGGFTPFCVEVTDCLEESNRLLLMVDNTRSKEQIPSLHYDWFNYGGIHRSVELVETPQTVIKNFHIRLSKDRKNQIDYSIAVDAGRDGTDKEGVEAVITIDELNVKERIMCVRVEDGSFTGNGFFCQDEKNLHLWNPDTPYLYKAKVMCQTDVLEDEIGFRRIETDGRMIRLNGESVFLKGMCVHEERPGHGRAVTEEDMKNTLETAKELGCNFLRLTHYPHNEWMAKLADHLGMMLWEEIPVYWALEFDNPKTFQDASNQLSEMIIRDRNRASVIIWSVGNENPDTDARYHFMKRLTETARSLDQSRLISASCLIDVESCKIRDRLIRELDIVGINEYYGWYLKDFGVLEKILENYEEDKPMIITETGADGVCGMHGSEDEIYTEECQAEIYRKQFEILLSHPFIRGTTPWILFDYASMRRMSSLQKGYNLKGIIGADRKHKKMAYRVVKKVYGKIV